MAQRDIADTIDLNPVCFVTFDFAGPDCGYGCRAKECYQRREARLNTCRRIRFLTVFDIPAPDDKFARRRSKIFGPISRAAAQD